jgi:hypothetical protein
MHTLPQAVRKELLLGLFVAVGIISGEALGAPISLQYVVPQNGSPVPDPSLIDARLDDGLGSTSQGFQTYDDFNDHFLNGTMHSSSADGRTVLRRQNGVNNQAGLRTNGNMITSAAFGSVPHGSNANTFNTAATNQITANGFRASLKIWLPDVPNVGAPIEFPPEYDAHDRFAFNGASFNVTRSSNLAGFGVYTNQNGEMVLFATQKWSVFNANRSLYEYVIPDLMPNDGTHNNVHIIDMIVPPSLNLIDFYVDGIAVPHMQDVALTGSTFKYGAVEFGDCCSAVANVGWAIEWLKVEEGVTTPHSAGILPGDFNRNNVVDAADYPLWRRLLGELVPPCSGPDANCNGAVDNDDYRIWKSNFGSTGASAAVNASSAAIPEPATGALCGLVAAMLLTRLRSRKPQCQTKAWAAAEC